MSTLNAFTCYGLPNDTSFVFHIWLYQRPVLVHRLRYVESRKHSRDCETHQRNRYVAPWAYPGRSS